MYQIVVSDYSAEYEEFCELFGWIRIQIRIALAAEHFDAAPAVLIFTTSLNLCGCSYGCVCKLPSHDPLPFIHLIVSQNQVIRARASGTDWVKSAVDVTSCTIYRLTIRIRSDNSIRPNTNTLFRTLFSTEANTKRIFGTSLIQTFV